eukprot:10309853-Karenia_brevis.AAC.1
MKGKSDDDDDDVVDGRTEASGSCEDFRQALACERAVRTKRTRKVRGSHKSTPQFFGMVLCTDMHRSLPRGAVPPFRRPVLFWL